MAAKRRAAARPSRRRARDQKYDCSAAVSAVVPDLLLTRKRGFVRSRRSSARRTAEGTVLSATIRAGGPVGRAKTRPNTSTHRLQPPPPRKTTGGGPPPPPP